MGESWKSLSIWLISAPLCSAWYTTPHSQNACGERERVCVCEKEWEWEWEWEVMCEVALLTLPGSPSTQHVHIHVEASKNMPTWQNLPQRILHINASLCTLHCTYHSISESKLIEQSLFSGRGGGGGGGEDRVLPAWTGSRHSVLLTQLERVCDNKPCEYTCTFVYVYMYCHLHCVYMYVHFVCVCIYIIVKTCTVYH